MKKILSIVIIISLLFCYSFVSAETVITVEELLSLMEAATEEGDLSTVIDLYNQVFITGDLEAYRKAGELLFQCNNKWTEKLEKAQKEWPSGLELMQTILSMDTPPEISFGDEVMMGDAVIVSIPMDWEKMQVEKDDEDLGAFLYKGTDEEGREIFFYGIRLENTLGTCQKVMNAIKELGYGSDLARINGVDMILTGDITMAAGMCLTEDGYVLGFGFSSYEMNHYTIISSDSRGFSDILNSVKLLKDMSAILNSVKNVGSVSTVSFEDENGTE